MRTPILILVLLPIFACGDGAEPEAPPVAPRPFGLDFPLSPLMEVPSRRVEALPAGVPDTEERVGFCLELLESGSIAEVRWAGRQLGRIGAPAVEPLADAMTAKLRANPAFARNALKVFAQQLPASSAVERIAAVADGPASGLGLEVVLALGNAGAAAIPYLVELAAAPDFRVSAAALEALGGLPAGPVAAALEPLFPDRLGPATYAAAVPLLARPLSDEEATAFLGRLATESVNPGIAVTAAVELAGRSPADARPLLRAWRDEGLPLVLELRVLGALARLGDESVLPRLIALTGSPSVAAPAVEMLALYDAPEARAAFRDLLGSGDQGLAAAALAGLIASGAPDGRNLLDDFLESENRDDRIVAALVLGRLEGAEWARLAAAAAERETDAGARIKFLNALGIHALPLGASAAVGAIETEPARIPSKSELAMNGADALLAMPELPEGIEERLVALAEGGSPAQRHHAARVLGRHGTGEAAKAALLDLLASDHPDLRMTAAAAMVEFAAATPEPLMKTARRESSRLRAETLRKVALRIRCRVPEGE